MGHRAMSVNLDVIRWHLESYERRGRSAAEAAGEWKWMLGRDARSKIIGEESRRQQGVDAIDGWLEEKTGDRFPAAKLIADGYADFLARSITIERGRTP